MSFATSEEAYPNREYNFVDKVPDDFFCMICTTVLVRNPIQVRCCRKHFCYSCLQKWYQESGWYNCPHCRSGEQVSQISYELFYREVSKLKVACIYQNKGCSWTGELLMLENHLSGDQHGKCSLISYAKCCIL